MTYTIINYAYFAMAMSYDVKLKQTARVEGRYNTNNNYNNSDEKKTGNTYKTSSGGNSTTKQVVEMTQYGSTTTETAASSNHIKSQGRTFFNDDKEYHELTNDDDSAEIHQQHQHSNNETTEINNKTLKVNEPPDYNRESTTATGDHAVSRLAISDNDEELNVESNHVTTDGTTNVDSHDCKFCFYLISSIHCLNVIR